MQFKGYWKLRIFLSYLGQQVKKKGQKIMIMYLFFNDSNLFRTSYYGNRSLQRSPMFQTSHFFLVISQEWHLCISSVNLCYSKGD